MTFLDEGFTAGWTLEGSRITGMRGSLVNPNPFSTRHSFLTYVTPNNSKIPLKLRIHKLLDTQGSGSLLVEKEMLNPMRGIVSA